MCISIYVYYIHYPCLFHRSADIMSEVDLVCSSIMKNSILVCSLIIDVVKREGGFYYHIFI